VSWRNPSCPRQPRRAASMVARSIFFTANAAVFASNAVGEFAAGKSCHVAVSAAPMRGAMGLVNGRFAI